MSIDRLLKISVLISWFAIMPVRLYAQEIIANKEVPVDSLTIHLARSIFAGRTTSWSNGLPITIFVFPDRDNKHIEFCSQALSIFPRQLRRSWDRMIYTGIGDGPIIVESEEEMIKRVTSTPGAIGYVINHNGTEQYVIPIK